MRKGIVLSKKYARWGWFFVSPAAALIFILSFYPMVYAFILSLQSGLGNNLRFTGLKNYIRLFQDPIFPQAVINVFIYLVIQVPIMLFLALILTSVLNNRDLKFKGLFRTIVFLPCATALVSSALIFKSFFSLDGIINFFLVKTHIVESPVGFLTNAFWARFIIILVITWRWTGYNTIFYLAGLQNIDTSVYEAARIDGASSVQQFFHIILPLLRPVILLTTIMSTNGTLQLFDEVRSITITGGPGTATLTISLYIYDILFRNVTQFGYAAAVSYSILIMVAILSLIQLKAGGQGIMRKGKYVSRTVMYVFLVVICVFSAFPFVWMLSAATNRSIDIIRGKLFPGTWIVENFKTLIKTVDLGRTFWNSVRNSIAGTLGSIFICSMAGYGFQIYRDRAKDRLMSVLLLSMMVPFASVMVPLYRMFSIAKLLDTTAGFILPSLSTAFLIFFFRQSSMSFPNEIVQAARVDGLGEFGIYARIYFPVMAPTFAAAAIVSFMANWNNYLWPLIIMQKQESRTMPMMLAGLTAGYVTDYGILMLAVTICTLPTVILFFTQQKRFVAGILGSVK